MLRKTFAISSTAHLTIFASTSKAIPIAMVKLFAISRYKMNFNEKILIVGEQMAGVGKTAASKRR